MIFPIGDTQVQGGHRPWFSYSLIFLNIIVFIYQIQLSTDQVTTFLYQYGSIPVNIVNGEGYDTLLTSMFLHGGWMHLIGNMLFLWVFADNIEATIGNFRFLLFYLLGGLAAAFLHIFFNLTSPVPAIGASGAISAVLGAYIVLFPKSKVKVMVVIFFGTFQVAAIYFLGFWMIQQLFSGVQSLKGMEESSGGVAWWAHIGGFAFGVLAGLFFKFIYPKRPYSR